MRLTTLQHALHEIGDPGHGHLALVAGLEAIGAILLLIPRFVQWGGAALLLVLLPGFAYQVSQGDWALELLIFASAWSTARSLEPVLLLPKTSVTRRHQMRRRCTVLYADHQ